MCQGTSVSLSLYATVSWNFNLMGHLILPTPRLYHHLLSLYSLASSPATPLPGPLHFSRLNSSTVTFKYPLHSDLTLLVL